MELTNQVTAVIPTLSNRTGLVKLLGELETSGIGSVVVDNGNQPEIKKTGVTYLGQDQNLGFAKAVNLGVKQAKTEWVWILNDDIEGINREGMEKLINKAVANKWAAISPILVKPDGQVENMGYRVLPIGKVDLNFNSQRISAAYLDGLTAAALLIERKVFQELGGFDESFFAYLEDVDLFLRLKGAGFLFGVDADIRVVHHHQTTSVKMKKGFKQQRDLVNWWRISFKHPYKFWFKPTVLGMLIERGRNLSGYIRAVT